MSAISSAAVTGPGASQRLLGAGTGGPLGRDLQVKSRSVSPFPGGLCPTITFAKSGLVVAMYLPIFRLVTLVK